MHKLKYNKHIMRIRWKIRDTKKRLKLRILARVAKWLSEDKVIDKEYPGIPGIYNFIGNRWVPLVTSTQHDICEEGGILCIGCEHDRMQDWVRES